MQTLSDLEAQMKSEFSYKSYREIMKGLMPPAIPYLCAVHIHSLTTNVFAGALL